MRIKYYFLLIFLATSLVADVKYLNSFKEASATYGVDAKLLLAIAKTESNFNPRAINKNKNGTADRGIMQINDCWHKELRKHGKGDLIAYLHQPDYNIKVGAWVLGQCYKKFGETWKAVDCYNKGPGNARNNSSYIHKVWKNYQQIKLAK